MQQRSHRPLSRRTTCLPSSLTDAGDLAIRCGYLYCTLFFGMAFLDARLSRQKLEALRRDRERGRESEEPEEGDE